MKPNMASCVTGYMVCTLILTPLSLQQITQGTNLHDLWCIGVLGIDNDHCKTNGMRLCSGWQDVKVRERTTVFSNNFTVGLQLVQVPSKPSPSKGEWTVSEIQKGSGIDTYYLSTVGVLTPC